MLQAFVTSAGKVSIPLIFSLFSPPWILCRTLHRKEYHNCIWLASTLSILLSILGNTFRFFFLKHKFGKLLPHTHIARLTSIKNKQKLSTMGGGGTRAWRESRKGLKLRIKQENLEKKALKNHPPKNKVMIKKFKAGSALNVAIAMIKAKPNQNPDYVDLSHTNGPAEGRVYPLSVMNTNNLSLCSFTNYVPKSIRHSEVHKRQEKSNPLLKDKSINGTRLRDNLHNVSI